MKPRPNPLHSCRSTAWPVFVSLVGLAFSPAAMAADFYWDGTTGNWNDLTKWSTDLAGTTNPGAAPLATVSDILNFNTTPGSASTSTLYLNGARGTTSPSNILATLNFSATGATTLLGGVSGTPANNNLFISNLTVNAGSGAVTIGDTAGSPTAKVDLKAGSISITNNSSNLLTLANGLNSYGTGSTTTFTFTGSGNTAAKGVIGNGTLTNVVAISKTGAGTLTFTGANTYTGATAISGGTLVFNGASNATSGVSIASGAVLELQKNSGTLFTTANFTITGAGTLRTTGATNFANVSGSISLSSGALIDVQTSFNGGSGSGTKTWTNNLADLNVASGVTFDTSNAPVRVDALSGSGTINAYSGSVAASVFTFGVDNGSGTFGGGFATPSGNKSSFTKAGTGTQTLTGTSSHTTAMNVNGGILDIGGGGTTGSLGAGGSLGLGGGTLNLTRSNSFTQTFTSTVINAGAAAVNATAGNTINLGAITRNSGGTVVFGTTGSIITSTANTNGILGGYATFGGSDWAVANGASPITGLSSYTLTSVAGDTATNYSNANLDVDSSQTLDAAATPNSFRFNDSTAARTVTLTGTNTIGSGGILVTSAVGNNLSTITGGNLQGPASGDLIVFQNNTANGLTIGSVVQNNTSTSLIKHGAGTLTLSGANTYSGTTTIHGGTLSANTIADATSSSIGLNSTSAGALTFGPGGGTLNFTGATGTTKRAIVLTGQGTFDVASGSTLTIGTATSQPTTTDGGWTGNGGIVKSGDGTLNVRNNSVVSRPGQFVVNTSAGGTFTMQAGTLNINTNGTDNAAHFIIGEGLTGVFNQTGGTVNYNPGSTNPATNFVYVGLQGTAAGGNATVNISGGTFTDNGGGIIVGRGSATFATNSAFTIGGGSGTATVETAKLQLGFGAGSNGTLNLKTGGVLLTSQLANVGGSVTTNANFDGGTLKAKSSTTAFMPTGFTAAAITSNGLTVDTNTFDVTIAQGLSGAGGLTKSSAGTLALTGANAYSGATSVSTGTLVFDNASNATSGVSIASGAVLELKNASSTLFTNSGGFTLTGAGTLRTSVASGTNNFGNVAGSISLSSGGLIDVQKNFNGGSGTGTKSYTNNLADLNVASGATFFGANGVIRVDALSGSGNIDSSSGSTGGSFTFGVDNGTGNFGGSLVVGVGANKFNFTKVGTGTQTLSAANAYTSTMNVNGGVLALSGSGTLGGSTAGLTLGGGQLDLGGLSPSAIGAVSVTTAYASGDTIRNGSLTGTSYAASNASGNAIISANLLVNSSAGFAKSGAGTVTLSGTNTYTGDTNVTAGTLALGGTGSIADSAKINVSTTLSVTGLTGNFTLGAAQTLGGSGTLLATGKTVTANGTLAPGNSPGTFTQDGGSLQLGVNGDLNWQMYDVDGVAGSGYDTISLTNGATLDLSLLSAVNQYNINLWSLSGLGPDVNGDAINFDNTQSYSWTLFSTGSAITGFDASYFMILTGAANGTAGFSNALGGGAFSVALGDGNTDLVLQFTAVPEPRAALLGGLGILMLMRRRRETRKSLLK